MGLPWKLVDGVDNVAEAGISAVLHVVQFTKRGGVSDVFIVAVTSRHANADRPVTSRPTISDWMLSVPS